MAKWNLNGNGLSFLTDEEQARVNASDNQSLRFRSMHHGMVDSDGDHLITADGRIVATWGEPPEAPAPRGAPEAHVGYIPIRETSQLPKPGAMAGQNLAFFDPEAHLGKLEIVSPPSPNTTDWRDMASALLEELKGVREDIRQLHATTAELLDRSGGD